MKKKLKQPSFAAGVSRDDVYEGAELLELELDEHIANVIAALQPIAGELGLRTEAVAPASRCDAVDEALEVAAVVPPADRRAEQTGAGSSRTTTPARRGPSGRRRVAGATNETSVAWPLGDDVVAASSRGSSAALGEVAGALEASGRRSESAASSPARDEAGVKVGSKRGAPGFGPHVALRRSIEGRSG